MINARDGKKMNFVDRGEEHNKKVFSFDSPLWKCVVFIGIEGITGKEHDRYIYDEEG